MNTLSKRALLAAAVAGSSFAPAAHACTSDSYIATVCMTAANFCPRGTADANGQLLSIAQNTALFSLIGTMYGGNGQTNFALPDLRGRAALHVGQGPGLTSVTEGQQGGAESASLTLAQIPPHTHTAQLHGSTVAGNTDSPAGAVPAKLARSNIYSSGPATSAMGATAITVGSAGSGQPLSLRNPYLGIRHCIVLEGIYPSRN
jgi:microcystin-dependent protein